MASFRTVASNHFLGAARVRKTRLVNRGSSVVVSLGVVGHHQGATMDKHRMDKRKYKDCRGARAVNCKAVKEKRQERTEKHRIELLAYRCIGDATTEIESTMRAARRSILDYYWIKGVLIHEVELHGCSTFHLPGLTRQMRQRGERKRNRQATKNCH